MKRLFFPSLPSVSYPIFLSKRPLFHYSLHFSNGDQVKITENNQNRYEIFNETHEFSTKFHHHMFQIPSTSEKLCGACVCACLWQFILKAEKSMDHFFYFLFCGCFSSGTFLGRCHWHFAILLRVWYIFILHRLLQPEQQQRQRKKMLKSHFAIHTTHEHACNYRCTPRVSYEYAFVVVKSCIKPMFIVFSSLLSLSLSHLSYASFSIFMSSMTWNQLVFCNFQTRHRTQNRQHYETHTHTRNDMWVKPSRSDLSRVKCNNQHIFARFVFIGIVISLVFVVLCCWGYNVS